jgi:hypothetical protein
MLEIASTLAQFRTSFDVEDGLCPALPRPSGRRAPRAEQMRTVLREPQLAAAPKFETVFGDTMTEIPLSQPGACARLLPALTSVAAKSSLRRPWR